MERSEFKYTDSGAGLHNVAAQLHLLKMPVLLIWGRNDAMAPPSVAETFYKLLPDAHLQWIDRCGHAAMMERSDEFNQILYHFLEVTSGIIRREGDI